MRPSSAGGSFTCAARRSGSKPTDAKIPANTTGVPPPSSPARTDRRSSGPSARPTTSTSTRSWHSSPRRADGERWEAAENREPMAQSDRQRLLERALALPLAAATDFFRRQPPHGVDQAHLRIIDDTALRTKLVDAGLAEGLQ